MRIGILGGSFDPVHEGHLTLARESERQFKLDKIVFIPALVPPHKRKEADLTPAPFRARMIELAIQDHPHWEVSDLELRRSGVSYTVDTLRELRQLYPSPDELFFIAGADSFLELETWKNPQEILRLCKWIVAPRPPFSLPKSLPPRFHRLEIPPIDISASGLREQIERGEDVSRWVPKKVWDYIQKMKIYREKR